VLGCYHLLLTIVDYAAGNKAEIKKLLAAADKKTTNRFDAALPPDSFALEYEGRPTPEPVTIKAFEADTIPGVKGYWRYKQSDRNEQLPCLTLPIISPQKIISLPFAYIIEYPIKEVEENLRLHGIKIEKLEKASTLTVQKFNIDELKGGDRLNQGHYTNTLKGGVCF